jgi:hypothetical protein
LLLVAVPGLAALVLVVVVLVALLLRLLRRLQMEHTTLLWDLAVLPLTVIILRLLGLERLLVAVRVLLLMVLRAVLVAARTKLFWVARERLCRETMVATEPPLLIVEELVAAAEAKVRRVALVTTPTLPAPLVLVVTA